MEPDWNIYNRKTDGGLRPILVSALKHARKKGKVLDIGCGAGNESRYLASQGFEVVSVDSNPGVREYLPDAVISKFEDFEYKVNEYDLVSAMFSLPFCDPKHIDNVMRKIVDSIKPEGVFVGQFFGPEDSWTTRKDMSFHELGRIREYFKDFLIDITEKKYAGHDALGEEKFWHVFHVIARNRL